MAAGLRIRQELSRYLAGQRSLRQFASWLAPVALASFEGDAPDVEELVAELEVRLAEYSNGHWSEEELRNLLRPLVRTYTSKLTMGRVVHQVTGSAMSTAHAPVSYSLTPVDKSLVVVSG